MGHPYSKFLFLFFYFLIFSLLIIQYTCSRFMVTLKCEDLSASAVAYVT